MNSFEVSRIVPGDPTLVCLGDPFWVPPGCGVMVLEPKDEWIEPGSDPDARSRRIDEIAGQVLQLVRAQLDGFRRVLVGQGDGGTVAAGTLLSFPKAFDAAVLIDAETPYPGISMDAVGLQEKPVFLGGAGSWKVEWLWEQLKSGQVKLSGRLGTFPRETFEDAREWMMECLPGLPLRRPFSFDDWIFNHPVEDESIWIDLDYDTFDPGSDPVRTTAEIESLFRSPERLIHRFSESQINAGLWALGNEIESIFYVLREPAVSTEERLRVVGLIPNLFDRLIAPLCAPRYGDSNVGPEGASPVNSVCYMWWDISPIAIGGLVHHYWGPDRDLFIESVLRAMEKILASEHPALQQSALHGLGHAVIYDQVRKRAQGIIDAYLCRSDIPHDMRAYASQARTGQIQ